MAIENEVVPNNIAERVITTVRRNGPVIAGGVAFLGIEVACLARAAHGVATGNPQEVLEGTAVGLGTTVPPFIYAASKITRELLGRIK